MVGCNCNKHACWLRAKLKNKGTATGLLVSLSYYRKYCLVSDMCAGPVSHNQTNAMVNMSTDPMAMKDGLLVWCEKNRHAHWPGAT